MSLRGFSLSMVLRQGVTLIIKETETTIFIFFLLYYLTYQTHFDARHHALGYRFVNLFRSSGYPLLAFRTFKSSTLKKKRKL